MIPKAEYLTVIESKAFNINFLPDGKSLRIMSINDNCKTITVNYAEIFDHFYPKDKYGKYL